MDFSKLRMFFSIVDKSFFRGEIAFKSLFLTKETLLPSIVDNFEKTSSHRIKSSIFIVRMV
jgi:hypothetical protein